MPSPTYYGPRGPYGTESEVIAAITWPEPGGYEDYNHRRLSAAVDAAGATLGAYDHRIFNWLAGWEPQTVEVIAAIIERAAHDVPAARGTTAANDAGLIEPRRWAWASWTHCTTCDGGDSATSRGWVDDSYGVDDYDRLDWHVEQGHEVSSGDGLLPEADRSTAAAVESWWEAQAQNEEAARLLLAGHLETAQVHAIRARELAEQYDGFLYWKSDVTPPADSPTSTS